MDKQLKKILEELTSRLELKITKIDIAEKDDVYEANIQTEEPSLIIGHGGESIRALQHLVKILLWKENQSEKSIFIDVDNYRKHQEESVKKLAERKVAHVRETKQAQSLLPMSPYFRRIVHLHLSQPQFSDIVTESVGEEDQRKIVIKPKVVE